MGELDESKAFFVALIEFIRPRLSNFSAQVPILVIGSPPIYEGGVGSRGASAVSKCSGLRFVASTWCPPQPLCRVTTRPDKRPAVLLPRPGGGAAVTGRLENGAAPRGPARDQPSTRPSSRHNSRWSQEAHRSGAMGRMPRVAGRRQRGYGE